MGADFHIQLSSVNHVGENGDIIPNGDATAMKSTIKFIAKVKEQRLSLAGAVITYI